MFLNTYIDNSGRYIISDSGDIDVIGAISLTRYRKFNQDKIKELPIQFGHIKGYFAFENANIETMKGFPYTITGYCSIDNCKKLKSLEFSPKCGLFFCNNCKNIESLSKKYTAESSVLSKKYTAESSVLSKKCTDGICTLDGLNCIIFIGENLNLKRIGTNFTAKEFRFNNFPTPTALKKHTEEFSMLDEIMYLNNKKPLLFKYISTMRRFIQLNPQFISYQKSPWITLINDYFNHKDLFRFVRKDTLVS